MARPVRNTTHDTSWLAAGAETVQPRFAVIAASSANNNELVAAVPGFIIRVVAYNYVVNAAVNVAFRSGATTVIGGLGYWGEQGRGKAVGFCPVGWFQTATGEALNLHLSGAVAVGGELAYVLIPE